MKISIGHGLTYLECPCCGGNGAASDGEGCFYDGQPLICGCPGWVSVDSDGDDNPWINNGDDLCQKCQSGETATSGPPPERLYHEIACPALAKSGPCTCNPVIVVG